MYTFNRCLTPILQDEGPFGSEIVLSTPLVNEYSFALSMFMNLKFKN